jgi:hydrophobic/amphiphilic exporter-1 (mainly G- bacteria), HAE1 family
LVAFAILVSLFVAYTLTPMLASRWLSIDRAAARTSKESRVLGWIEWAYGRALRWSMAHRWVVVVACVAALLSVVPLFIFGGKDFLPKERRVAVRGEPARPGGHHRRADRAHRHARQPRDQADAGRGLHDRAGPSSRPTATASGPSS